MKQKRRGVRIGPNGEIVPDGRLPRVAIVEYKENPQNPSRRPFRVPLFMVSDDKRPKDGDVLDER
jgi:hypothetical protein